MHTTNFLERYSLFLLSTLAALCLAPWLIVQFDQSVNVDIAWLTIAAERLLAGQRMSDAYYDGNPPLSVLVQIVPAFLVRAFNWPLPQTVFLYSLSTVALSVAAVHALLKRSGLMEPREARMVLFAYGLANTLLTGQYMGERDHEIVLALTPFVIVQLCLTLKIELPRVLKWAVLIIGSVAVLIKPHYGLVPLMFLAHRAVRQRRLSVLLDADGLALVAATLGYALVLFTVFPDFLRIILPDSLLFYVSERSSGPLRLSVVIGLFNGLMALCAGLLIGPKSRPISVLFLLSCLCLIPFALQGKGFFYQAIPAMVYLVCAMMLMAYQLMQAAAEKVRVQARSIAALAAFGLFAGLGYLFLPPNVAYPTHRDYERSNLAQVIRACGDPCPFFMFNDMTEVIHQLAVYTHETHASRFPSFWFLPVLLQAQDDLSRGRPSPLTQSQVDFYRRKYAAMVAADLRNDDPKLLLIGQFQIVPGEPAFDFPAYFGIDPAFRQQWSRYVPAGTVDLDPAYYFRGTLAARHPPVPFLVYKRKIEN